MIYFLVNNNYHFIDVESHVSRLDEYDVSLIQIPHKLDVIQEDDRFRNIYSYTSPFIAIKDFFNLWTIRKKEREINVSLKINPDDILFAYTEYEILNQYIIAKFKKAGAKTYIIEDGGFPTYLTYNVKNTGKLPWKKKIKLLFLNYIVGYSYTKFLYFNGIVFPQIEDRYIDGVLLYLPVSIKRNIKRMLISRNEQQLSLDSEAALFLNEKIYEHYCSPQDYEKILEDVLDNLSKNFKTIYFKFHPRENEEHKNWQRAIIQIYSNITIIEENTPIEKILENFPAKYVFSYFSAALLNLKQKGAIPTYIFHLYDTLNENQVFQQTKIILEKLGYQFMLNWSTCKNESEWDIEKTSAEDFKTIDKVMCASL